MPLLGMFLIYPLIYATLLCHVCCLLFKRSETLDTIKKTLWKMCFVFAGERSGGNRPVDVKVQQLMLEFKVNQYHIAMALASFFFCIVLVPTLLFLETTPRLTIVQCFLLLPYIPSLVFTFTSFRLSPRSVDLFCSLCVFFQILRCFVTNGDFTFFSFAGSRVILRVVLSLIFIDIRKMVICNILLSIAVCWQYKSNIIVFHQESLCRDHLIGFLILELTVLSGVVILAVVVQLWIESRLRATLDAECAHHGMHKLLSTLCDAVLRLGPELHVTNSTPQLLHLLGHQQGSYSSIDHTLDGSSFISLIASKSDQRRFQKFISDSRSHMTAAQAEGGPPALIPLHMQDAHGRQIPVEVFHAHLPDAEQRPGHLLGIRLVGELPTVDASDTSPESTLQHVREHASATLDLRSGLSAALPRRRISSRASSKSSASLESVLTYQQAPLSQIANVSFVVDAFDPKLRISACTVHLVENNEDTPTYGILDCIPNKAEAQQFLTMLQANLNAHALGFSSDCLEAGPLHLQLPMLTSDNCFHLMSGSVSISLQRPAPDGELMPDGEYAVSEEHDMFNSEFITSLPVILKLESLSHLERVWTRRLKKPRMSPVIEGRRSTAEGGELRRLRHPR